MSLVFNAIEPLQISYYMTSDILENSI